MGLAVSDLPSAPLRGGVNVLGYVVQRGRCRRAYCVTPLSSNDAWLRCPLAYALSSPLICLIANAVLPMIINRSSWVVSNRYGLFGHMPADKTTWVSPTYRLLVGISRYGRPFAERNEAPCTPLHHQPSHSHLDQRVVCCKTLLIVFAHTWYCCSQTKADGTKYRPFIAKTLLAFNWNSLFGAQPHGDETDSNSFVDCIHARKAKLSFYSHFRQHGTLV